MVRFSFVIVVVLPFLALVVVGDDPKKDCLKDEKVNGAAQEFSKCLNQLVQNSINNESVLCSKSLDVIINDFVKTTKETCFKKDSTHNAATQFHDLLNFSLKHFNEFVENNGIFCIREISNDINNCFKGGLSINKTRDPTIVLWKNTKWTYNNAACADTKMAIKDCTLRVMRSTDSCKNINLKLYVSSLFDYMVESCHLNLKTWDDRDHQGSPVEAKSNFFQHELLFKININHILLAALLTVAIFGTLYVVVRDCKTSGQWKKLSEQIEMKQVAVTQAIRRRSLANKDRIHEH